MNVHRRSEVRAIVFAFCVLVSPFAVKANAQTTTTTTTTTTAPSATEASKDEVVQLSPFQVNANDTNGYRTDSTVSGSKISTPLMDLPLTIDVIDREFLDDVKATGVKDALTFVAGVTYLAQTGTYDTDQYGIRGFHTDEVLRNGIYIPAVTDQVNLERVEVVKGPAGVLYGVVSPGGLVNYTTKKPFDRAQNTIEYTYGSYNYNMIAIDANQPLNDSKTVLFRLPLSYVRSDSNIKYVHQNRIFLNPVLTLQASSKTLITLDYTYKREAGTYNRGGFAEFLHPAQNGQPAYYGPATAPYYPWLSPWTYGEVGPADHNDVQRTLAEIVVEQQLSANTRIQFEVFQSNLRQTDTGHFMSEQPFPQFTDLFNGYNLPAEDLSMSNYDWVERVKFITRHYEVNLFNQHDFGTWQNKLVTGIQGDEVTQYDIQFYYPGTFPSTFPAITAPDAVRYSRAGPDSIYVPWFNFTDPNLSHFLLGTWGPPDIYATDQISAMNNKLHLLFGLRYQEYADIHTRKVIPQAGIIYALTNQLSGYATYSTSTKSNGISGGGANIGQPRSMEKAAGYDFGVKANLLDGRLTGTVAYFDIKKTNVALSDFSDFIGPGGKVIGGDIILGGTWESKGVEVEVQARPTAHTQVSFEYSHDDAKDTKDGPLDQGAQLGGAVKDAVTFLAKYHFSGGALDGFEFGGGGRMTWGDIPYNLPSDVNYHADIQLGNTRDYTLFVHYNVKLAGHDVAFGVTCKNITDDHYIVSMFTPSDPRQYFVDATVHF